MTNRHRLLATLGIAICVFVIMWTDNVEAADENFIYVEAGAGVRLNGPWVGDYPSYIETGYVFSKPWKHAYVRAYFNHTSNIERGAPFNNKNESYLDQTGVAFGWRF